MEMIVKFGYIYLFCYQNFFWFILALYDNFQGKGGKIGLKNPLLKVSLISMLQP
jgi:hypothetical protein